MPNKSALIGKAGEMLVAAELLRLGVEVAVPAVDSGVDLFAFRLNDGYSAEHRLVPIQVKAWSAAGYHFERHWFERASDVVLVSVWHTATTPEFYVMESIARVEEVLGARANTRAWRENGIYTVTNGKLGDHRWKLMQPHRDKWERVSGRLFGAPNANPDYAPRWL
jgi:hypothetical protein